MPPATSIIIPTNRALNPHLLAALREIVETRGFVDVVVVRTYGSDAVPGEALHHERWVHVSEPQPGLLAGRHRGAREARGEILIYLDDDVRVNEGWLDAILAPFADASVHLVGCRYLPDYAATPPAWLDAMWTVDVYGRWLPALSLLDYGTETQEIDPALIWGLCYAIRRETLTRLGGFHPDAYPWELRRYRGDGEAAPSRRARQLQLKAVYQGKAPVHHQVPASRLTPEYFARRSYLEGVSDSYSRIRAEGRAPAAVPSLKAPLRAVKQWARATVRQFRSPESAEQRACARAYTEGFHFHQAEVARDSALLAWVLRPDYTDYALPQGWETLLPSKSVPAQAPSLAGSQA